MSFAHLPLAACALVALLAARPGVAVERDIQFSRDILPLLSDRCFHCHGPDASHREADLRLDLREEAVAARGGAPAIAPHDPDGSELLRRITAEDPDLRMPPAASHREPLTAAETELMRQWIAAGAPWGRHWAFEPPRRAPLPPAADHPIDAFVADRLAREGLSFSPPAAAPTLLRRLSFDLTGLPPAPDALREFVRDPSPRAYQQHADRLFASPHYGERLAMWWLDVARYADTDGFQQDATRTNWPWRDWVVQAFQSNMPFDEFTIQQFAGDLLPDASPEQILATCFHRNHMTNGEGGRDPEESRVDYVIDRVNTTGAVWLGLTLGCCQCHSHKFDPISQREYYQLSAFFNSIDEDGKAGGGARPFLEYRSPHSQRALREAQLLVDQRTPVLEAVRRQALRDFTPWLQAQRRRVSEGFEPWPALEVASLESVEGTELVLEEDSVVRAAGPNPRQDDYRLTLRTSLPRITGVRLDVLPDPRHADGKLSRGASGEFILTDVKLMVRRRGQTQLRDVELQSAVADVEKSAQGRNYGNVADTLDDDPRNGWTTAGHDPRQPHAAVFALAQPLEMDEDLELIFVMLHRSTTGDANIGKFRLSATDQAGDAVRRWGPTPLERLAAAGGPSPEELDDDLRAELERQYLEDHAAYQHARRQWELARDQREEVKRAAQPLKVMVLAARETPRATHVLQRGVWDAPGEQVRAAFPAALGPDTPAGDSAFSRLDLARWLVHRDNPLTARVVVNHLWQLCFGAGLVRTPEDFGLQGERPDHPELLDWLAVELMDSGWDVQHLLRLIVTSQTYQQSSHLSGELLRRDPENRLLARGARFRLPSWMIRDAALAASGLLNEAVGGPPTRPYQPDGVWAEMFMGRFRYTPSQGPAQHRRTLYAFWRRSSAPTFLFDAAQRRVCEVGVRRTNTPLHALTLMNDAGMLEASRELAAQAVSQRRTASERVAFLFQRVLSRPPSPAEAALLLDNLEQAEQWYRAHPDEARQWRGGGQATAAGPPSPADQRAPGESSSDRLAELAACQVAASLILNLDEAITHE